MSIVEAVDPRRPKVLRRLRIDEFSFCDAPANADSRVLVCKAGGDREALAKAAAAAATLRANARVDEVYAALAKRDTARAGELLRDAETYDAYQVRIAGGRYQAPVAVTKAEPDHRAGIRKAVAARDMAALGGLFRADEAAHRQYHELLAAGELAASAAVAKKLTPADVPEAEKAATKQRIRTLLAQRDAKGLDAVRRTVAGQAAWIDMALAGEVAVA